MNGKKYELMSEQESLDKVFTDIRVKYGMNNLNPQLLLDTIKHNNLRRIKALQDFGDVKRGEIGGFVQSEDNLSHEDECWIYSDAMAIGNSIVRDNARLLHNAFICDNSQVYGHAIICNAASVHGKAQVYGNAFVAQSAIVQGFAKVRDDAKILENAVVTQQARIFGHATVTGVAYIGRETRLGGATYVDHFDNKQKDELQVDGYHTHKGLR